MNTYRGIGRHSTQKKRSGSTIPLKLIISGVVFLLAFTVKLLAPGLAANLSDRLLPVISAGSDYKAAFAELGEIFSGKSEIIESEKALAGITPSPSSPLPFETAVPVDGELTSEFGQRIHPITKVSAFHYGVDIGAETGDDVRAFAHGTVVMSGESSSMGLFLLLEHANGYCTRYAHLSVLSVSEGDSVDCGQVIGLVGQTGMADGPHLHFELTHNDEYMDPADYIFYAEDVT